MKRFSFLATAAISALALIAAIGAASASAATVLCKTHNLESNACAAGDILPAGSYQTFGGTMTLTSTTTGAAFTCSAVAVASKTTAEKGSPLPATGEYGQFAGSCLYNGASECQSLSIANTENQISLPFVKIGVTTIGSKSAPLVASIKCFGVTCEYTANSSISMGITDELGWEYAAITNAPMTRTKGGFLCPGGTSFELDYEGDLQNLAFLGTA